MLMFLLLLFKYLSISYKFRLFMWFYEFLFKILGRTPYPEVHIVFGMMCFNVDLRAGEVPLQPSATGIIVIQASVCNVRV